jgi:hypothetical protein
MTTRSQCSIAVLVFALATTSAHADDNTDTLPGLAGQWGRIKVAGSKMKKEQKRLDAETVTLGTTTRKLEAEAPVIVEERARFGDFNSAVNAMVDAWNGNCAGEQEPAKYDWCVKQREQIEPEVTKRDTWDDTLTTKETDHDAAVEATQAAVAANTTALADLQAAKDQLKAIEDDWRQRAAAWRVAQAQGAARALCRAIPDSAPERQQACWSSFFDGSNPLLRECLDMPLTNLRGFQACLDRKVAGG